MTDRPIAPPEPSAAVEGCVFCRPDNRNEYGEPIYSLTPLNPVVPGHRLFIPSTHLVDASQNPVMTGRVFTAAARWAREQGADFNLITSGGADATQSVFHLHVHYVPRVEGDGLPLPWTPQHQRAQEERAAAAYEKHRVMVEHYGVPCEDWADLPEESRAFWRIEVARRYVEEGDHG